MERKLLTSFNNRLSLLYFLIVLFIFFCIPGKLFGQTQAPPQQQSLNHYIIVFRDTTDIANKLNVSQLSISLQELIFSENGIVGFDPFNSEKNPVDALWIMFASIAAESANSIPSTCQERRGSVARQLAAGKAGAEDFFDFRRLSKNEILTLPTVIVRELRSPCRFKGQFYTRYASEYAPIDIVRREIARDSSRNSSLDNFFLINIDPLNSEDYLFIRRIGPDNVSTLYRTVHNVRQRYVSINLMTPQLAASLQFVSSIARFIEKEHFLRLATETSLFTEPDRLSNIERELLKTRTILSRQENMLQAKQLEQQNTLISLPKYPAPQWLYAIIPLGLLVILLLEIHRRSKKKIETHKERIHKICHDLDLKQAEIETHKERLYKICHDFDHKQAKLVSDYENKLHNLEEKIQDFNSASHKKNRISIPDKI